MDSCGRVCPPRLLCIPLICRCPPVAPRCSDGAVDVFTFLKDAFDASYDGNRAPFPLFVHTPWIEEVGPWSVTQACLRAKPAYAAGLHGIPGSQGCCAAPRAGGAAEYMLPKWQELRGWPPTQALLPCPSLLRSLTRACALLWVGNTTARGRALQQLTRPGPPAEPALLQQCRSDHSRALRRAMLGAAGRACSAVQHVAPSWVPIPWPFAASLQAVAPAASLADYAATKPDVYFVTVRQLLAWMQVGPWASQGPACQRASRCGRRCAAWAGPGAAHPAVSPGSRASARPPALQEFLLRLERATGRLHAPIIYIPHATPSPLCRRTRCPRIKSPHRRWAAATRAAPGHAVLWRPRRRLGTGRVQRRPAPPLLSVRAGETACRR